MNGGSLERTDVRAYAMKCRAERRCFWCRGPVREGYSACMPCIRKFRRESAVRRVNRIGAELADVLHAIEWCASGDWLEDDVIEAVEEWRKNRPRIGPEHTRCATCGRVVRVVDERVIEHVRVLPCIAVPIRPEELNAANFERRLISDCAGCMSPHSIVRVEGGGYGLRPHVLAHRCPGSGAPVTP